MSIAPILLGVNILRGAEVVLDLHGPHDFFQGTVLPLIELRDELPDLIGPVDPGPGPANLLGGCRHIYGPPLVWDMLGEKRCVIRFVDDIRTSCQAQ